jgi:ADP-heptose:LPS heptosyltransferase
VESSGLASQVKIIETRSRSSVRETLGFIRSRRWDVAVDYQGLWKSAAIPFLGGVKRRIGFSWKAIREFGVPVLYSERVTPSSRHIADQNGELSLHAGAAHKVSDFSLQVPEEDARKVRTVLNKQEIDRYVLLSPGGGWRSKCWPAEKYGELCDKIFEDLKLRCVINYGPGEENLAEEIVRSTNKAQPLPYSGNLAELMALLKNAACLVGGDTGPLHLGVALKTPAVALFGPTDPLRNGPYASKDIVLRDPSAVTSYKRGDQPDPSMLRLEVEDVLQAVRKRMTEKA